MSWNNLTDRQKDLDRAIDRCGITASQLSMAPACIKEVCRRIGASSSEEPFIRERIALRLKTASVLQDTNAFIGKTEAQLDRLAEDDKRWEQRLKAVGINLGKR